MKFKPGDIILGLFIVGTVMIMIIPISSGALDVFITINIALALIIMLNALFSKESLNMATFPTVLLFTTIYRLSLNLASTRLILNEGDAGNVVDTFGEFVAGGSLVVGVIVFMILVIINFMVITKGSERVAEVTARFTLDAMPGKQMAIDADLNSGLIEESVAKSRRQKIQDEAAFFGAMDGASKFVKGDAVAGLIITFINIVAGIIIGSAGLGGQKAIGLYAALEKYSKLTIGDGLVSQIPALLISLATGILVTKVSKEADIGDQIRTELFSSPKVLFMTGFALIFLGVVTPLTFYVMGGFGIMLVFLGNHINNKQQLEFVESEITDEDVEIDEIRKPENVVSLLQVDQIELEFGYGIIPLADTSQGGDLLDRVVMIRRQIALELGAIVPIIRLRDNIQLNPNEYVIKIKGIEVSSGEILYDHYMAMNPGYVEEEIDGIETVEPAFNLPAMWISESQREKAEMLGYTVVDPPSIIATHLTEIIKKYLSELLTRQDVQTLINNVVESNPTLVEELVPKVMSVGEIQKVLMNLLHESVSIRDLVTIFETLADYATTNRDPDILTEYVRQNLKRAISKKFLSDSTNVITLDPNIEQIIMDSVQQTESGSYLGLDPSTTQKIFKNLTIEVNKLISGGQQPIVLASSIVRIYFKKLTENTMPELIVLSYNEIDANVEVQSVGMVSI